MNLSTNDFRTTAVPGPETEVEPDPLFPPVPDSIAETGLSATILEQVILKLLYFRGEVSGRDLSTAMGLRFSSIECLLDTFKRNQAVQVTRSLGMERFQRNFR